MQLGFFHLDLAYLKVYHGNCIVLFLSRVHFKIRAILKVICKKSKETLSVKK